MSSWFLIMVRLWHWTVMCFRPKHRVRCYRNAVFCYYHSVCKGMGTGSVDQGMVLCGSSVLLCCLSAGMMIESMAGKSGALHGLFHDATPFTFSEDQPAAAYFGDLLRAGNATCSSRLGTEPRQVGNATCSSELGTEPRQMLGKSRFWQTS